MKKIKESLAQKNKLHYIRYHTMRSIKKSLAFKQTLLKDKKAFSLVELLVIIVIISVMATVSIPGFREHQRQSEMNSVKPILDYVDHLIELQQDEDGNFINLTISNTPEAGQYCVVMRVNGKADQQPVPSHFGNCGDDPNKNNNNTYKVSSRTPVIISPPKSGFVVIALGETEDRDIGINHLGDTALYQDKDTVSLIDSNGDPQSSFTGSLYEALTKDALDCKDYTTRADCYKAGCQYVEIEDKCQEF